MTSINLQEWITHPEFLNKETLYELRNLLVRYPYFQTVRLLYLKNLYLLHDVSFGRELRKAALYVTDRRVLFYLIEGDKFVIRAKSRVTDLFLDCEPGLDRTLSLIDTFLLSIPEESTQGARLDISTDYAAYLLEEDFAVDEDPKQASRMIGQALIDGFIEKADNNISFRVEPAAADEAYSAPESVADDNEEDESCFTETLAKIYVKQKRYSKALEIIKKLSLKYPKKNAYFADQIRFLEKLIINTKSK